LTAACAMGSSFLGPNNEAYQITENGYNPNRIDALPTGPKNLGEEYRRVTPIIYYSFDQNFIDYFGTNGMDAIDKAFAVYNGMTNVSSYSQSLLEFPMEAQRVNYQAQALFLTDLKSTAMSLIMEQLGAAQSDRYVWTLHARWHIGTPPCPAGQNYTVVKRNFDPMASNLDQLQPTSYVNGTLYSYRIVEFCQDPTPYGWLADAVEFNVDPLATTFTPVASGFAQPFLLGGTALTALGGLGSGNFYTGLTRDDIGTLRYLLRAGNINREAAGSNTVTFATDKTQQQLLATDDLNTFAEIALFSDPATLVGLYPNLQIISSTPIFTNLITTNVVFSFTNSPFDPAGNPPRLVSSTVIETNIFVFYNHTFGNAYITPEFPLGSNFQIPLVPGHSYSNGIITTITTNISSTACGAFAPPGLVCTNVSLTQTLTPGYFGDFYILPTNLCQVSIIATQLMRDITITNFSDSLTVVFTNAAGEVISTNSFYSETPAHTFKQYIYLVNPVVCPENSVAFRRGIERVVFVRRDYDSLIGNFYYPTNNDYILTAITNNTELPQLVRRVVTGPDILITAADLAGGPGGPSGAGGVARGINWDSSGALNNLAGPGTIITPTAFTFTKVGPIFGNTFPLMDEATGVPLLLWGSFDGSTNAPVVYPNGTSVADLENLILIQVSPAGPALPDGTTTSNYTNVFSGFTATGGAAPYSWGLAPASPGLPPGLTLNSTTGVISGVPATPNIYDFIIRMTDSNSRFVDRPYSIAIAP